MRNVHHIAVVGLLGVLLSLSPVAAQTIRYALTHESRIRATCHDCESPAAKEKLSGTFDLTVLPIDGARAAEALTAVRWESESYQLAGAGFLQRIGESRVAMVIDARVNDTPVLLTSGRRQRSTPGEIRIRLTTAREEDSGFRVYLVAVPVMTDGPDADADGVPDLADNCPAIATMDHSDSDRDGIGDACDDCPETSLGSPVSTDGCSPSQACSCEGPSPEEEWASSRDYVQCVARSLKKLRREGQLSRSEVRRIIQNAVRSGCGRRILAAR